mgnify:CR=1 FL=1
MTKQTVPDKIAQNGSTTDETNVTIFASGFVGALAATQFSDSAATEIYSLDADRRQSSKKG